MAMLAPSMRTAEALRAQYGRMGRLLKRSRFGPGQAKRFFVPPGLQSHRSRSITLIDPDSAVSGITPPEFVLESLGEI